LKGLAISIEIMKNNTITNWEIKKDKLMKEYPHLTQEDVIYQIGREEELLERLQKKLNKNKEEIRKWLSLMG
jgi:hypothetical protein